MPTSKGWVRGGYGRPCSDTVVRLFGSFSAAVREAGYVPETGGYKRRWTRRTVARAILLWRLQHGDWPSFRDWIVPAGNPRTGRSDHPHANTVTRVFGSWKAAQRAAGRVY